MHEAREQHQKQLCVCLLQGVSNRNQEPMRMEEELRNDLVWEIIRGQCISKSNGYVAVPDTATGGRRIIKSDKVRNYERSFEKQCIIYRDRYIDKPFIFHLVVYESSWAFDLDGAFKILLDKLQDVHAITNDNLCIEIKARKVLDPTNPRVAFALQEVEPRLNF